MRAALYIRVSSQEQAQRGVSIAEQRERLESWAKMEDWQVVEIYSDEGYTGGSDNRPELQRLMSDTRTGLFDIVAVTRIDRFFRNNRLLLNTLHELDQYGISFVAQSEGIDTSKPGTGKIILNMLGAVAEWERERIGDRIKDFRNHLANKGQWSSGRTPFGYRFNKESKELIVDPLEVEAIRFIFSTYVNEEVGLVRTAEICNANNIITPRAGRRKHEHWTQSAIRHVLTHAAYKGGPNEGWPFKCPVIVDNFIWESAQRRLANNRHFRASINKSPYQGLLRCGFCGYTLRIGYNHSTDRVWECPGRLKKLHLDGSSRCILPRFKAEKFESNLGLRIEELFLDRNQFMRYINMTLKALDKERRELERRLRPIKGNIEKIIESMARADTMYEVGRISTEDYKVRIAGLKARLRELERQTDAADPLLLRNIDDNEKETTHLRLIQAELQKEKDILNDVNAEYQKENPDPAITNKLWETMGKRTGEGELYLISQLVDEMSKENPDQIMIDKLKTDLYNYQDPKDRLWQEFWQRPDIKGDQLLRKLGLFIYVYPKRIEIKGVIRKTNISPGYRSGHCRQFQ